MATWPSEVTLFDTAIKGSDANPLMKTWMQTTKQLLGAVAPVTVRIKNGSITPTAASLLVDTEGGSASDVLSTIATSGMQDGAIIELRSADTARVVTVRHSTGSGGLTTIDGKDVVLDTTWGVLGRLIGGRWQEIPGGWRAWDSIVPPDGTTIKEIGGTLTVVKSPYELCEFYFFRHPTLRPGFQPAQGGLLANAATKYPEAWAYLQTTEGKKLCTSEAAWQAMTRATWATLADGTKVGWNGIGGAPFYAPNTATGALRLPDLRGMYAEAAGFDALGVGGTHGDGMRNIVGQIHIGDIFGPTGCFATSGLESASNHELGTNTMWRLGVARINLSGVVPIANKVQPRAWGALACVYLGLPAS